MEVYAIREAIPILMSGGKFLNGGALWIVFGRTGLPNHTLPYVKPSPKAQNPKTKRLKALGFVSKPFLQTLHPTS